MAVKRLAFLCIILALVSACGSPPFSSAKGLAPRPSGEGLAWQSGSLRIYGNQYEYAFRDHITFRLEASSDAKITEITLFVRVSGESGRQRDEPDFVPDKQVSVEVVWEKMEGDTYRPPGVEVEYWWTVKDAAGNELKTDPVAFAYMDEGYPWQALENKDVALYWYKGDDSLGSTLFERAVQAVGQISAELGVEVEDKLKIFIYGTYEDLRASLGEGSHEWVGGISFTDYAVIAVGVAPSNLSYGLRVVPHELTHAVIAQMMEPPFGKLPHWMDEGLAMHYEGPMTDRENDALERAISGDTLLSIRSLASNFPADPDLATLSYAESNSAVEFIFEVYGEETMAQLLEVFAVGAHQDDGFREVLGFDVDGLEDQWRAHIGAPPREGITRATPAPRPTLAPPEAATPTLLPEPTAASQAVTATADTPAPQPTATATLESEPLTGLCLSPLPSLALLGLVLLFRSLSRGTA